MFNSIIIRDKRLKGGSTPFSIYGYPCLNVEVDQFSPLIFSLVTARGYAMTMQDPQKLFLMAHSYVRQIRNGYDMWAGEVVLGMENLSRKNVQVMGMTKNVFKEIVIFSCTTAYTFPGEQNTVYDGERFCWELAQVTQTPVVASADVQTYNGEGYLFIDFGKWEGKVYKFYPDGRKAIPVPNDYLTY